MNTCEIENKNTNVYNVTNEELAEVVETSLGEVDFNELEEAVEDIDTIEQELPEATGGIEVEDSTSPEFNIEEILDEIQANEATTDNAA